jgi:hypothetical protein
MESHTFEYSFPIRGWSLAADTPCWDDIPQGDDIRDGQGFQGRIKTLKVSFANSRHVKQEGLA